MNALKRLVSIGTVLAMLAGCGSSGGDNSSGPLAANLATITTQNAPVIAGAVVGSALEGGGLGSLAALGPLGVPVSSTGDVFAKINEVQREQTEFLKGSALSGEIQTPIPPQMTMCPGGGMMTLTGDIQNALTLSPNDSITIQFESCADGMGGMTNGMFTMQITSFEGDLVAGTALFGMTVTVSDFQVTADGVVAVANGSVSMTINTQSVGSMSISITSPSLSVASGGVTGTLSNFSVSHTIDEVTGTYTYDLSGSLTSSEFEGQVNFSTSVLLQGTGTGYASVGEVVISGADGASIRVIALDGVLVRLEIHLDDDGVAEDTVDTTWAALTDPAA